MELLSFLSTTAPASYISFDFPEVTPTARSDVDLLVGELLGLSSSIFGENLIFRFSGFRKHLSCVWHFRSQKSQTQLGTDLSC